jgi:hypothetical protein
MFAIRMILEPVVFGKFLVSTVIMFLCWTSVAGAFMWHEESFGDNWSEGGTGQLQLLDEPGGSVVREWSDPLEWDRYIQEVNEAAECVGVSVGCASDIIGNKTPIQGATESGANSAQADIEAARSEGTSLIPEDTDAFIAAGQSADVIPAYAGTGGVVDAMAAGGMTAPPAALAGGALVVGVVIGNGLDQLFGLPDLEELIAGEEEITKERASEEASREGRSLSCSETSASFDETHFENEKGSASYAYGGTETTIERFVPAGCYLSVPGSPGCGPHAVQCERQESGHEIIYEPGGTPEPPPDTAGHWTLEEFTASESVFNCVDEDNVCYGVGGSYPVQNGRSFVKFKVWRFESGPKTCELTDCLTPKGVPAPNIITPAVEANNVKAGMQPLPIYPTPLTLPKTPPARVTQTRVKELSEPSADPEHPEPSPIRKRVEEFSHPEERETQEEAKPLEIPIPKPDELATTYATEVEAAGFTSPAPRVYTLNETSANPEEGPGDVAAVSPEPGSRANPSTQVEIGANPDDAAPGETGGGLPGPTEPGIKFPNFGVLCRGFPFGVPCWLIKAIESWSATGVAPEWGFENLEIDGTKIPDGKFKLSALEPIMEVLRPIMVGFATIGLVLLFHRFAKGGSPSSGGSGEADMSQEDF